VRLVLVAAPRPARGAPGPVLRRAAPPAARSAVARWGRRLGPARDALRPVRHPVAWWLLHVAALWFWHASVPYGAALDDGFVHLVEHASFLVTGIVFWGVVIGGRRASRVPEGFAILLVFALAMQGVFLSALLTFARQPWYTAYAGTTAAFGLDPLADQQLAGVIMWVPAGLVYPAVGLALTVAWLRESEREPLGVG
jgi:cytochrome c oxidase assembly factor CtaG